VLKGMVDLTSMLTWLVEEYPGSVKMIKNDNEWQSRFKSK
jgi:hypothetical protein